MKDSFICDLNIKGFQHESFLWNLDPVEQNFN